MRFGFDIPEFLDWVVSTWSPVATMADRVAYSRSHFSRKFSASVGESAQMLRRRLQLEAAAYLLKRTDYLVGEVAVEVGYETPEAFSKAFGSAFGTSPSQFKKSIERSFRLPSETGIHFHPSGLIVRRQGEKKMKLSDILIQHHVDETATILTAMANLVEGEIDKRVLGETNEIPWDVYEPTLRGVMRAIVATEAIWVAALEGEPFPEIDQAPSLDSLIEMHRIAGERLIALVLDIEANDLWASEFVDALCDEQTRFEFGGVIAHILTFSAHRRLMALAALRNLGVSGFDYGDPINWLRAVRGQEISVPAC